MDHRKYPASLRDLCGRTDVDAAPVDSSCENASVILKAAGGKSDQGGGVAVRLKTPESYYLVQLDALRDRVLFSLVSNGESKEIAGVDADIASHAWHTLAVRAKDDEFVVSLDGTWMFTAFDKTLSRAGRIALWTEGDASRASTRSKSRRCHESVVNLPRAAFTIQPSTQGDYHDDFNRTPNFHSGSGTHRCRRINNDAGGEYRTRPNQPTKRSQNDAVSTKTAFTRPEVDQGHIGKGSREPL
jgi:hypothetical protein